ncbi:osteopetrosis-associated transmembrane protein 1 [Cylas formicarius]|uniref:osteopetrosis-associated transmembrane protein 1 n=1 Tax=Cylas formicarius TaxID=197179 RepID=UPI002958BEBF|nr:osteopetrosis-associated transmembrane protein 1 [Cylas formicarius]
MLGHYFGTMTLISLFGMTMASQQTCINSRQNFSDEVSIFFKCSIDYSRPITFCKHCIDHYINILTAYNNLSQTIENGSHCIDYFINLDRLQIVQTLYHNALDLWSDAKCYKCYKTINGSQTNNTSDESLLFTQYYQYYNTCVTNTTSENLCIDCMNSYVNLQNYFFAISNENEKIGVCMDIEDLMNETWTFWGSNCCKFRKHNEYIFVISCVIMFLLTISFYVFVPYYAEIKSATIIRQTRMSGSLKISNSTQ